LVSQAGTIYIERGRRRAVPEAILAMRERLKEGWPVALFPEATTHWGPALGPFHGNLLEAAIAENAEVVPIGVRYLHADGSPGEAAHFLGEQTFVQSVWAILGARALRVELLVLPPVPAAGKTRAALAAELRGMIGAALGKVGRTEQG
ncbi:MAG: lysophospholipid acyltransferase family protein, partial [Lautropia sp.]|nr:lysophospholipid acyltransferase family protein [Lautropia sp.]